MKKYKHRFMIYLSECGSKYR